MEVLNDYGMLLRWVHFIGGVTWVGLLWFFNLVHAPASAALEPEVRARVLPELMPRALWWFRWGAAVTWLSGVVYAYGVLSLQDAEGTWHWITETTRGQWITLGFVYGSVMAFNVWFVIWPLQQQILRALRDGRDGEQLPAWSRGASAASRLNTYLSVPLLFAMGAARHLGDVPVELPSSFASAATVVTIVGFALAALLVHVVAPRVGRQVP